MSLLNSPNHVVWATRENFLCSIVMSFRWIANAARRTFKPNIGIKFPERINIKCTNFTGCINQPAVEPTIFVRVWEQWKRQRWEWYRPTKQEESLGSPYMLIMEDNYYYYRASVTILPFPWNSLRLPRYVYFFDIIHLKVTSEYILLTFPGTYRLTLRPCPTRTLYFRVYQ